MIKSLCDLNSIETKLSAIHEARFWEDNFFKKAKVIFHEKLKNSYFPEKYVIQNLNLRSCVAHLRYSVLPLHVETGR